MPNLTIREVCVFSHTYIKKTRILKHFLKITMPLSILKRSDSKTLVNMSEVKVRASKNHKLAVNVGPDFDLDTLKHKLLPYCEHDIPFASLWSMAILIKRFSRWIRISSLLNLTGNEYPGICLVVRSKAKICSLISPKSWSAWAWWLIFFVVLSEFVVVNVKEAIKKFDFILGPGFCHIGKAFWPFCARMKKESRLVSGQERQACFWV